MSITPEREESDEPIPAYLNNKIVIMTKEGVTVSAKEDLANYNIGIQAGSAALEAVTERCRLRVHSGQNYGVSYL